MPTTVLRRGHDGLLTTFGLAFIALILVSLAGVSMISLYMLQQDHADRATQTAPALMNLVADSIRNEFPAGSDEQPLVLERNEQLGRDLGSLSVGRVGAPLRIHPGHVIEREPSAERDQSLAELAAPEVENRSHERRTVGLGVDVDTDAGGLVTGPLLVAGDVVTAPADDPREVVV